MKWLHISDIHLASQIGQGNRNLRRELLTYLEHKDNQVDEVFMTGDFSKIWELEALDEDVVDKRAEVVADLLKEIAKRAGVTDTAHVHIVPGNHDMRADKKEDKKKMAQILKSYDPAAGEFVGRDPGFHGEMCEYLWGKFEFFRKVDAIVHPKGSVWTDTRAFHKGKSFEEFNLVYMNTCIAYRDGDRGNMIVCNSDVDLALSDLYERNPDKPVIVLAHHGSEYFLDLEVKQIEAIFLKHNISLYLCGDSHMPWGRFVADRTLELTSGTLEVQSYSHPTFFTGEISCDGYLEWVTAHYWNNYVPDRKWRVYDALNDSLQPKIESHRILHKKKETYSACSRSTVTAKPGPS